MTGLLLPNGLNVESGYLLSSYGIWDGAELDLLLHPPEERYPEWILTRAADMNNENENDSKAVYPLYDKILYYWFPPEEGFLVYPWDI
ncbi:hypothetical protein V8B97DRAFT_1303034 [Scleroderma yunnanense]